jgi:hypothetical protein
MSRPQASSRDHRAERQAMSRALLELRHSVANRRPISLPNLLRFYRRTHRRLTGVPAQGGLETLRQLYRRQQSIRSRKIIASS